MGGDRKHRTRLRQAFVELVLIGGNVSLLCAVALQFGAAGSALPSYQGCARRWRRTTA